MKAYVHTKTRRADGSFNSFATIGVDCKEAPPLVAETRVKLHRFMVRQAHPYGLHGAIQWPLAEGLLLYLK